MKERPNLNELAKEIHNDNKLKGFHDVDWSDEHCLMLAICELCEAIEADRHSIRADVEEFNNNYYKNDFENAYIDCIVGSIDEELADFVIRLLDLAGKRNFNILNMEIRSNFIGLSFNECMYVVTEHIARSDKFTLHRVQYGIYAIENICKLLNIDLWLHVSLKLKYNKTRPYKHGKEY